MARVRVRVGDHWYTVDIDDISASPVQARVDGQVVEVEVEGLPRRRGPAGRRGHGRGGKGLSKPPSGGQVPPSSDNIIRSPMHGKVVSVAVEAGSAVQPGTDICVLEAMKMEQTIRVSQEGVVARVLIVPGQQVRAGDPLLEMEGAEEEE